MSEKRKKIIHSLDDDDISLLKGGWTPDGRKIFNFDITEIKISNSCLCDVDENKIISKIYYILKGKGNPPAEIWIYKGIENRDCLGEGEEAGIGTSITTWNDKGEEELVIEIVLRPEAFEDFVHTISALRLRGQIKFNALIKKLPGGESDDIWNVILYKLDNALKLPCEETA